MAKIMTANIVTAKVLMAVFLKNKQLNVIDLLYDWHMVVLNQVSSLIMKRHVNCSGPNMSVQ